MISQETITEAYEYLRYTNKDIAPEVFEFMKEAALEKLADKLPTQVKLFQNMAAAAIDYNNSLKEGGEGSILLVTTIPPSEDGDRAFPAIVVAGGEPEEAKVSLGNALRYMPSLFEVISDAMMVYQIQNNVFRDRELN